MHNASKHQRKIKLRDWEFYVIDNKDKEMYSRYIRATEYPTNLWSSNFDYLWAVSHPRKELVIWKVVDGMLSTFKLTKKQTLQLAFLPMGKANPDKLNEVVYQCLKFCYTWNGKKRKKTLVRVINELQLAFLRESPLFERYFKFVKLRGVDRHVGINNLLTLTGKRFENVRRNVNRFQRNYPDALTRRAKPDDYDALLELKDKWNHSLGKKYSNIWDDRVYRQIIKHHQELDHVVLVVEIKGEIVGMITGGILPHGQAWGGLSKRKEEYSGLSEFLNIELAREINRLDSQVEMINIGIDVGPRGGLRAFKDKFRPVLNCERYRIYLK